VLGRAFDPHRTAREALVDAMSSAARAAASLFRRPGAAAHDDAFWALRDVSFDVPHGEALGLIGGNGAGKSTLLKLLTRITAPTTGRATIQGRVGSLLEVGTGFHPDLTGRENVFLNGAILGMRREEVVRKFDEIVAFAEVERFIDTPVKRYSSGMYLRLAFAVAAHLEPEVLLVDEVLAVGDAAFQAKCLGKMSDVTAEGRTVVFVSHNLDAIQRLCPRSVLLDAGRVADMGRSDEVVRGYLTRQRRRPSPAEWLDVSGLRRRGTGGARFEAVRFTTGEAALDGHPYPLGPLELQLEIDAVGPRTAASLAVVIRDVGGTNLVNADIAAAEQVLRLEGGPNVVSLRIESLYLNPGEYTVDLWLGDGGPSGVDYVESAFQLLVHDPRPAGTGPSLVVTGIVPCALRASVVPGSQRDDARDRGSRAASSTDGTPGAGR
jgi:ABC-type polysaccharide/polyol phosphate transport system ATPase subunit